VIFTQPIQRGNDQEYSTEFFYAIFAHLLHSTTAKNALINLA
jgi:hypothetical protein